MREGHRCRSCSSEEVEVFLSLGKLPLPDALLRAEQLEGPEPRFPLDVAFCTACSLVQLLEEVPPATLFVDNYLYFSSYADALVAHAGEHARSLIEQRGLGPDSLVVEIASNDGYLLRTFADRGIPVLGIDPAPDQAAAARAAGVPTREAFFGTELAREVLREHGPADVIIANNVMAHVPELNGFVAGMKLLLADDGVVTVENPYVRDLIRHVEFDTIYHEHLCYFSCTAVDALARRHGLWLNRVEEFPDLHGGTLRWTLGHHDRRDPEVDRYLTTEAEEGLTTAGYYADFGARVESLQRDLRRLLAELRGQGARIAAYGAAAKGSVLLNATGIGPETIDFVVDRNVHKQGLFMPGVHIPVRDPAALLEEQPDFVLLLAWNFRDEIIAQQAAYVERGGRFVVPVPVPQVVP